MLNPLSHLLSVLRCRSNFYRYLNVNLRIILHLVITKLMLNFTLTQLLGHSFWKQLTLHIIGYVDVPLFVFLYFSDFRLSMATNHQIIALKPLCQFAVRNEGQRKIKLPILFKNYKTLALMTADCHWK